MSLSTILDSVPQVPRDYANHFVYGGALGAVAALAAHAAGFPVPLSWLGATAAVFGLCAVKKISDYLVKHETLSVCVGKTIVTALLPALFLAASYLK